MKCRHNLKSKYCEICCDKTGEILTLLHEVFLLATITEETLLEQFTAPNSNEAECPSKPIPIIGKEICWLKFTDLSYPTDSWSCVVDQKISSIEFLIPGKYSIDISLSYALTAITSSLFEKKSLSSEITLPGTVSLSLYKQDERFSHVEQLLIDAPHKDYLSTISSISDSGKSSNSSMGMFPSIGVVPTQITLSTILNVKEELRLIPCLTIDNIGIRIPGFLESEHFIVGSSGSIISFKNLSHFKLKCLNLTIRCQKISQ